MAWTGALKTQHACVMWWWWQRTLERTLKSDILLIGNSFINLKYKCKTWSLGLYQIAFVKTVNEKILYAQDITEIVNIYLVYLKITKSN